jgi:NADH:ubiquinone oxidoreductase subunit F (NADH-binding)
MSSVLQTEEALLANRLLRGGGPTSALRDLAAHQEVHGSVRDLLVGLAPDQIVATVAAAGLTGRGGAGFPTARKLAAVAAGQHAVVVANAAEGEPASNKDKVLLSQAPHLVLDGLQLACRAVGATEAYVYVHEGPLVALVGSLISVRAAQGLDHVTPKVVAAPARFVSGQESAVVARLNGGQALPIAVPPPVYRKGVGRNPTLVQNVETLAQLALIARRGASWFRTEGTSAEPGTMLATVSGAVASPGVVETAVGTPIGALLDRAGGPVAALQGVLVGGYHGTWLGSGEAMDRPLSVEALRPLGASPGAGVVVALAAASCGVIESARVVAYLADQSARQCGPCLSGLPAMAQTWARLAARERAPGLVERVEELSDLVAGRGACHHPDGTVRFVRSALTVFAGEVAAHLDGRCTATDGAAVLPTPGTPGGGR